MASKSMWSDSISFGLVNIPATVYLSAVDDKELSFNQICPNEHSDYDILSSMTMLLIVEM